MGADMRESDLSRHLENLQGDSDNNVDSTAAEKDEDGSSQNPIVSDEDYQLNQAVNLLKGLQIIRSN